MGRKAEGVGGCAGAGDGHLGSVKGEVLPDKVHKQQPFCLAG